MGQAYSSLIRGSDKQTNNAKVRDTRHLTDVIFVTRLPPSNTSHIRRNTDVEETQKDKVTSPYEKQMSEYCNKYEPDIRLTEPSGILHRSMRDSYRKRTKKALTGMCFVIILTSQRLRI